MTYPKDRIPPHHWQKIDRCDVCGQRLLVAELAYRTVRIGGQDIGRAGHPDCLNQTPTPVEPPVTEGDRRRPKSNRSRGK